MTDKLRKHNFSNETFEASSTFIHLPNLRKHRSLNLYEYLLLYSCTIIKAFFVISVRTFQQKILRCSLILKWHFVASSPICDEIAGANDEMATSASSVPVT